MLLSDSARVRAQSLSAIAAGLSILLAAAVYFGLREGGWPLLIPIVVSIAATVWPTRLVVAIAMLATAAIVILGTEGYGILFGASAVALMLALNNLQSAATQLRRSPRR